MTSSSIALCCLKPFDSGKYVSEQTFKEVFDKYGPLESVLIFKRSPIIKAFVGFLNENSLNSALAEMNAINLNIGRISLFRSSKNRLHTGKSHNLPNSTNLNNEPSKNHNLLTVVKTSEIQTCSNNPLWDLSPTDKSSTDNNSQHNFGSPQSSFNFENSTDKPTNASNLNYHSALFENPRSRNVSDVSAELTNIAPELRYLTCQGSDQGSRRVLHIFNMRTQFAKSHVLTNLFCCFGNVVKMIVNTSAQTTLVEFETSEQASLALRFLDGQTFLGRELKITIVKGENLDLTNFDKKHQTFLYAVVGEYRDYRYKSILKIKFNPPSKLLHFTSISENVSAQVLFDVVTTIQEPIKIVKLGKKGVCSSDMFLVEFDDCFKATEVLSVLHNKIIDQKSIKVSFSQTKI